MKKLFWFLFFVVVALAFWQKDLISQVIVQEIIFDDYNTEVTKNEYAKSNSFELFAETNSFKPGSKEEFNNILYTILNSGMDEFSFYCMFGYDECINDFNNFINYADEVEVINNFVHPFNSFENISVAMNNFNKITIKVDKMYNSSEIEYINQHLDNFINKNIKSNMSDTDKIKAFHDYIIDYTKYDSEFKLDMDKDLYKYHPYSAYGLLTEKKAICSGYSDIMAIYLNKIGIKNYKIASDVHVWNYVFINNNWYHLDLTWDDPVTNNNKDMLIYDFFLITTNQLEEMNIDEHNYNKTLYLEAQ